MGTMADPPPLTEVADVVATRVKSLRVKSGWTQDEAAARLRAVRLAWGQAALSRFEKGGREPTVSELILLAAAFGTTPADLLQPAKDVTHVVLRSSGATGLKYGATVPAKAGAAGAQVTATATTIAVARRRRGNRAWARGRPSSKSSSAIAAESITPLVA